MKAIGLGTLALFILGVLFLPAGNTLQPWTTGPFFTCTKPNLINHSRCHRAEEKILRSTVRLKIETWEVLAGEQGYAIEDSTGHATVIDGQHLLTHNHFSVPLSIRQGPGEPEIYSIVYLYDVQGQMLTRAPLTDFTLVQQEDETMLLAHREPDFFQVLGLVAASLRDWRSWPGEAGTEVAQIDWDGHTTRVDWTTVRETRIVEGIPVVVLEDGLLLGASGGGIFWQGYHVGNIWRLEEHLDGTGDLIDTLTVAALNSPQMAGQAGQD